MSGISHLLNESCRIFQRRPNGSTDRYGNPTMGIYQVDTVGHFQTVAGSVGSNGVYYTAKGWFGPDENICEDDLLQTRGKKYWVNSVEHHISPTGSPSPYISVQLRETEERQVMTSV